MAIAVNDFLNEYELMGWIIESRWSPENWEANLKFPDYTNWSLQWNHKIYNTEDAAKDAMKQSGSLMRKQEFRYRPVYSLKLK